MTCISRGSELDVTSVFLKSINIREDLDHPSRLAHYHPTARSIPLVGAVLRSGATMAIASYGSGKSLAAGIGALAVANDPKAAKVLSDLGSRISKIDPELARQIDERVAMRRRGKVVVLSGYVGDLAEQIGEALGLDERKSVRSVITSIRQGKIADADHISIVWDEFGRHLEGLVRDARSRDLEAVQDLAELAERPSGIGVSLILLLHQNVLAYAQNLNQTSRNEWRKIEGRFNQMRFVEDSRELYSLAAKLVGARASPVSGLPDTLGSEIVSRAIEGRWFDDIKDPAEIGRLIRAAWPLSAAALQVLPRLVARVGQNERSLFSFLNTADFRGPVGMNEVYEAFSEQIRSDVGVGGLQRQWVEVESARGRTENETEREVLAAAFLLQAGVSGERRHLKRSVLVGAVVSRGIPVDTADEAVSALVSRKLLIHRKLNDEVSVWHGADVDVASRLRDERAKIGGGLDIVDFLAKEHQPPFIRPVRHNVSKGVSRYLAGTYAMATELRKLLSLPFKADWGRIVYVIANTAEEVGLARSLAAEKWERTILVIPADPVPIHEAVLEIEALLSLKRDEAFIAEDPLVVREIDELLAVARRHLTVLMHRLTTDRPNTTEWWHDGARLPVDPDRPAGVSVSDILDGWFPKTPRIANDQIVRTELSRPMKTARIRMITRLMGHAAVPSLGYGDNEGAAEASVYRTVLMRTGLHYVNGGIGAFASPSDLSDPALAEIWGIIEEFFTKRGRKKLSEIVQVLSAPPYGVAAGLLPILVMAGYKAFAKAVAIRTEGTYVRDILGFDSARIFLEPEKTEIEIFGSSQQLLKYLDDFSYMFLYERPGIFEEKVMFANMAFEKWLSTVAEGARRSKRMPENARALLRSVQYASDPAILILETLPELLGPNGKPYNAKLTYVIDALQKCRNSIDGLVQGYLRDAVEVVEDVLHLEGSKLKTVDGVLQWVACFDVEALRERQDMKLTDLTILKTVEDTRNGRYSAEGLARILSQMLMKRGVDKWQDDTKEHFRKELREARQRIEAAALDVESPSEKLIPVIESRMKYLENQLARIRRSAGK